MINLFYVFSFISLFFCVFVFKYLRELGGASPEVEVIETSTFSSTKLIRNPAVEDLFLYLVFPSGEASNNGDEGLAHYVEHLAWKSAFGGDHSERMRHSNAWTNHFSTGYWYKVVDDDLQRALRALVGVASPLSVKDDFALEERDIVLREYDYRVVERPLYSVFRDMDRALYGNGALARSVIGEPEVIAGYSFDAAASLHKRSHALSGATLLVYGDVSEARLETALASLSVEGVHPLHSNPPSIGLVEDGVVQDRIAASLAELSEDILLYRKLVPLDVCDTPAGCAILTQLADEALSSSLTGGLAGPLRYDRFVTRSFSFDITVIGEKYVEVSFIAHPDTNTSLDELENEFRAALHLTLENGLPQETFDRIASRLAGQFDSILERDRPGYNRDLILHQLMSAAPVFTLEDQINAVEDVRLEDVNEFLISLLADGREATRLVRAER